MLQHNGSGTDGVFTNNNSLWSTCKLSAWPLWWGKVGLEVMALETATPTYLMIPPGLAHSITAITPYCNLSCNPPVAVSRTDCWHRAAHLLRP